MAVTVQERKRIELYEAMREFVGEIPAMTLLELLPMDTSQLATKQDLALQTAELRAEMHELFREQTNRILMFVLPTMLSGVGLAFAAAKLG